MRFGQRIRELRKDKGLGQRALGKLVGVSFTDISKEYRIYEHERLKGLSPSAYFVSKWLWLTLLVGILAPLVLLIASLALMVIAFAYATRP